MMNSKQSLLVCRTNPTNTFFSARFLGSIWFSRLEVKKPGPSPGFFV
jgi:hypothetical protein